MTTPPTVTITTAAFRALLAEAWERGHFYCAAEQGDSRCRNPYRDSEREEILRQIAPDRYTAEDF